MSDYLGLLEFIVDSYCINYYLCIIPLNEDGYQI